MWEIAAVLTIWLSPPETPHAPQLPGVVSCRDGHLAPTLADCPVIDKHRNDPRPVGGGGGGGRGGLLGLGIGGIL